MFSIKVSGGLHCSFFLVDSLIGAVFPSFIYRKFVLQKFTYLLGYLGGSALQCIEGFPRTEDCYVEALKLLKERFGNTQLIISTHMNRLLNLEKVTSCSVSNCEG